MIIAPIGTDDSGRSRPEVTLGREYGAHGDCGMLTVDISLPDVEELVKLVEAGQERGFVLYEEVSRVLEEVEIPKEQVEDFFSYLLEHGIELVEAEGGRKATASARRGRRRST
jgi:hypothetical protein